MRSKIDIVIRINIIDLLFFINTKNIKLIVNLYDKKIKKVYCLTEKNKTIKTTLILGDLVFCACDESHDFRCAEILLSLFGFHQEFLLGNLRRGRFVYDKDQLQEHIPTFSTRP
jgi:hypothetical protein